MDTRIHMSFNITSSQKETIHARMQENGFDDIASYVKVVAIKTQVFDLSPLEKSTEELAEVISFEVSEAHKEKIEQNVEASSCANMQEYLTFVALHGIVNAVVEVRSTGSFDDMVQRIAKIRGLKI